MILTLNRAGGHALDDLTGGEEGEEKWWDHDQRAHRHDAAPLDAGIGDEAGGGNRQRAGSTAGEQEGEDEFVPGDAKGEDAGDRVAGLHEGKEDPGEHLKRRGAVDDRGLLQLHRDLFVEAEEEPDGEGKIEGGVEEDENGEIVLQAERGDHEEGGHGEHRWRHHADQECGVGDEASSPEFGSGERIGAHAAEQEGEEGRDGADDDGVGEIAIEFSAGQDVLVVFERGEKEKPEWLGRLDDDVVLEGRRDHHPDRGETDGSEDDEGDVVSYLMPGAVQVAGPRRADRGVQAACTGGDVRLRHRTCPSSGCP